MRRPPHTDWKDGRRVAGLLSVLVLVLAFVLPGAAAPAAATAQQTTTAGPTPTFEVRLLEDGSALVSLTMRFDLESETERESFNRLKADHDNLTDDFTERMRQVARATENETGREMRVSDASVSFLTVEDTDVGVVTLTVRWSNLARVEGDRLVLSEPFASGFEPNRRFVVTGPDGYEILSTTPGADQLGSNRAVWRVGGDFSGFRAIFTRTETGGTPTETRGPAPLPTALLAALAVLVAFARRQ